MVVYIMLTLALFSYIYNGDPVSFYRLFPLRYTVPITALTLASAAAFGIASALLAVSIRSFRARSAGAGIAGIIMGSLALGCPGCVFGLFPIVLGFFGITGTLGLLPLRGVEFQIASLALLLLSSWWLAEDHEMVCKIKK